MEQPVTSTIEDLVPLEDESDVRVHPEPEKPRRRGHLILPAAVAAAAALFSAFIVLRGSDEPAPRAVAQRPVLPTSADAARFAERAALSLARGRTDAATPALEQRLRLRAVPNGAHIYALSRRVVSFTEKAARVEVYELGVVGRQAIFATARLDLRWTGSRYRVTALVTRPGPVPGGARNRRQP